MALVSVCTPPEKPKPPEKLLLPVRIRVFVVALMTDPEPVMVLETV